jgi:mitochondrial fission protein ELM1
MGFMQKSCWIITDGSKGMVNQCLGVAESLGVTIEEKKIRLRAPWRWGSPFLTWGSSFSLARESSRLNPPYPDLVISCGRQAIIPALYIKKVSKGKATILHVQNPVIDPKRFDALIVPYHDNIQGPNIIQTLGAPHRLSVHRLQEASSYFPQFHKTFSEEKRIGVLIGGPCKAYPMEQDSVNTLIRSLRDLSAHYRLLISPSRRTPSFVIRCLEEEITQGNFGDAPYLWRMEGDNPYFSILANADAFVITCDSVCMITEACVTDKPVYLFPLKGGHKRFDAFYQSLLTRGRVEWFPLDTDSEGILFREVTPFNEMEGLAHKIKQMIPLDTRSSSM